MKQKLFTLFVALIATTALWAGNTITYTATEKLTETADSHSRGLHTNAFNVSISSHTFSNGTGTITFAGDVTSIGNYAFKMCSVLTSVTIPNSVATIGGEAFYDCDGLTSVMIGNSVTTIGYYAFYDCNVLSSITIPNSVTKIEYNAFAYCSGLTSITIPSSVTEIGSNAFIGCSGLTSVTLNSNAICGKIYKNSSNIGTIFGSQVKEYIIGDSVTSIGNYAFWKCSGLTSATIGNSVTTIGECAFCQCGDLTIEAIPNSVMTIGNNAFQSCSSLTLATIGNSVTTIGKYAFCECSSLTSMTIPNSVTTIGECAFSLCTSLTSVIIGNSVTMIGYGAFSDCDSLISITCKATTPPTCGSYCFDNVDKAIPIYVPYNSIPAYKATNGWKAFTNIFSVECQDNTPIHYIDSITTCYGKSWHNKFYSKSGDYYDTIPNRFGCDSIIYQLNLVVYPSYYSEDTIQINQGDTIFHNKGTKRQYYEIPIQTGWSLHLDTFQNIYGCDSTIRHYYVIVRETELTCPEYSICGICGDDLIWILDTISGELQIEGVGAMYDYYESDLPWKNYLDNIKTVTIPQGLTYMYNYAFIDCPNLETVYWNVKQYGTEYTNDNNKWSGCRNFIFGDSVKSIPGFLCYGCDSLKEVIIPNGVLSIGGSAFASCSKLTSVTIGNSVTTIGSSAFYKCSGLTSIDVAAANTHYASIDGVLFNYAKDTLIQYPIGNSRTEYTIPNSVATIGDYAFFYCRGLTSVTIGNSVTTIGEWAFYDCRGLTSLTCKATTPPTCGSWCFADVDKSIPVYVPAQSISAYKQATGWKEFTNIHPISDSKEISGQCGDSLIWVLDTIAGTIVISGSGEMDNYAIYGDMNHDTILAPWTPYQSTISKVVINDGVITIGNDAFIHCKNISQVELGNTVTTIGSRAFSGCSLLKEIRFPESLTTLKAYAFGACGFDSIFIPKTLTNIYYIIDNNLQSPFRLCRSLKRIIIEEGNPNYDSRDDCNAIIESKSNTLMFGCVTSIIPNTITTIAGLAFYGTSDMIEISIPKNVSYIGDFAFGMSNGSQQRIYCEAVIPPIAFENTFNTCPKDIPVYVPAQSISLYKVATGWKDFTNIQGFCDGEPYFNVQDTTICGQPYTFVWKGDSVRYGGEIKHGSSWNGEYREWWDWRDRTDTTTRNYISVGGCDSALQLVVHYPHFQYAIIRDTIEEGESFWSKYTETGIYYERVTNVRGCDSIVSEIHLFVKPKPTHVVILYVNNAKYGSVEGGGTYNKGDTINLIAIPNKGYQFNQWNDGVTTNPRTIYNIDKDYTLTAQFGIKQCSWLVESNDLEMGAVSTTFTNEYYNYGTQITVEASANSGYKFVKWNDGKKHNPYKFSLLDDKYLLAIFMAEEEEMDTTQVQSFDTTATFTWPFIVGGFTYTLTIYLDAACTIPFCTLTFNQYGQLIGITFGAHAPRRSAMANQEEGFTTTINGLSAGTEYFFKMETKDEEGKLINTDEGGFITKNSGVVTNINRVLNNSIHNSKFIMDGHLYILRDGNLYTATGAKVK